MSDENTPSQELTAIPLEHCLAKTRKVNGKTLPGRTVEDHCRIVGAVAEALLHRMPNTIRRFFPEGTPFTVSLHDVGKVVPFFQNTLHTLVEYTPAFPELQEQSPARSASVPHHSEVSWATLKAVHGRKSPLATIAGWHHGRAPVQCPKATGTICGGLPWQQRRIELIERLRGKQDWPTLSTPEELVMLKGLTVVADWIGSGTIFDDPATAWEPLIAQAVDEAGFIPVRVTPGKTFQDIFGFAPNPIQEAMTQAITDPGVYVLEAPMGMGKTEAALFAAYRMLETGKAHGIYFALPTQLTSNAMYARLMAFLKAILTPECQEAVTPLLLHGMAWLYASHEEEEEHAGSWFTQSKRGLLAPFGTGTLDQALMAIINVRHPDVRSFGLAGKVVILDEVHSYDAYTGSLLDSLVQRLRALDCTVIILSATLTHERLITILGKDSLSDEAYPRITGEILTGTTEIAVDQHVAEVEVQVCLKPEDKADMEAALLRAEQGQQVLWVENTVREAQERYRHLAARAAGLDIDVGLVHSRFTPSDRQKNEARWTRLYGKASEERHLRGRILIGTQVLEQSLDIDADFLVTAICPTDMLFQRMGRLWRHADTVRPVNAQRAYRILAPTLEEAHTKERAFGPSAAVYSPYVLARTLEVWAGRASVCIPQDIRPLLEATYAERPADADPTQRMRLFRAELEKLREKMKTLALASQSVGQTLPDAAATRFIEEDTSPVLMVQELDKDHCILADGRHFRFAEAAAPRRREISAMLFSNMVQVRRKDIPGSRTINTSAEKRRLFAYWLPVKENYEGIFLMKLRPDGSLEDLCTSGSKAGYYDNAIGWEKERYTP